MINIVFRDLLLILTGLLIPGLILLARSIRRQTHMQRDIAEIKHYVTLLCEKQGIDCVLKERK